MSLSRILPAMLGAALLWAGAAEAQRWNRCDPRYYFISASTCTTYGEQAAKSMAEMRVAISEETAAIAAARRRFWETYPDKPGAVQARDEFARKLDGKDSYYLWLELTDALGGVSTVEKIGGKLDGGIPRYSTYEFRDWVEEIKRNFGEKSLTNSMLADPVGLSRRVLAAMAASEKKRDMYVFERNWGEFDAVGREPAGLEDPAAYFQAVCVRSQKIAWDDALIEFNGIVKALGKDNVLAAIQKVHAAPRERFGMLKVTMPPPVKRTPAGAEIEDNDVPLPENVIGVTASAIRAVERLATQGDDRRYALWLLTANHTVGSQYIQPTKWQYAETAYQRLVVAFGEKEVLDAARLVRTATKRATTSDIMDPKAIGATRGVPLSSIQDILARKNPRGYLRAALMFSENLDSSSAVEAAYKKLLVDEDEEDLLEAARKMAAGRPNVLYNQELKALVDAAGAEDAPAAPQQAAKSLVDFPPYLAWKGFTAGAKVVYSTRYWRVARPGDAAVPDPLNAQRSFLLQSINAEQARLWDGSTLFDKSGKPRPPHENETVYPAKYTPPATPAASALAPESNLAMGAQLNAGPTETGEESVEVNGKRIATRWQSASYNYVASQWPQDKDCKLVVKLWTSSQVPTGLVRKTEDKSCPPPHPYPRMISETFLESFAGFTPATADASIPVAPAYAPPQAVALWPETGPAQSGAATPKGAGSTQPAAPPRVGPPPSQATASSQAALAQRFNQAMSRAGMDKYQLAQEEAKLGSQGAQLPAEVREARDRIDPQIRTAIGAMQSRDNDQFGQGIQKLEDGLAVIEKYLKR